MPFNSCVYKHWIIKLFALLLSFFLFIGITNYVVDPYNVFRNFGDYSKNEISTHLRLFKSIAIRHQTADLLLFGDSQVEHGIDPVRLQKITNQTVFNATFSSMQIYELRKYLELSLHYNKPKTIIAGLQMYDFMGKLKYTDDYSEAYMNTHFNPYSLLFSIDTTKSSIKTIEQYINNDLPLHNHAGIAIDYSLEPYKNRFLANEKHYFFDNAPQLNLFKYQDGSNVFDEFKKILHLCHTNNITLILFISPSHARQWEITDIGNSWEIFEFWKKQLVILNEQIAKENHSTPFILWDFSGYHNLQTEAIPKVSEKKSKMRFFYESSHYTPELGNIVLDRIFESNVSRGGDYSDFGVKLTTKNIQTHFKKLKEDRVDWQKKHPADLIEINALKQKKSTRL